VTVKISKNYIYEEDALMKLKPYQQMLSNIQSLSKKHRVKEGVMKCITIKFSKNE